MGMSGAQARQWQRWRVILGPHELGQTLDITLAPHELGQTLDCCTQTSHHAHAASLALQGVGSVYATRVLKHPARH